MKKNSQENEVTTESSKEKKTSTKEKCAVDSLKSAQRTIYEFLVNCTPFQADAVRVMITHGFGEGELSDINVDDILAVNRFLNYGMNKSNTKTQEEVYMHRHKRMGVLLELLKPFLIEEAGTRITLAVVMIASNPQDVSKAFSSLPVPPVQ